MRDRTEHQTRKSDLEGKKRTRLKENKRTRLKNKLTAKKAKEKENKRTREPNLGNKGTAIKYKTYLKRKQTRSREQENKEIERE